MKKQKVNLKKLSLQKRTIAAVNANSVQGGTGTVLETRVAFICNMTGLTVTIPVTNFSQVKTACITDPGFNCPSKDDVPCIDPYPVPIDVTKTALCG